jgi:hypothetical protein
MDSTSIRFSPESRKMEDTSSRSGRRIDRSILLYRIAFIAKKHPMLIFMDYTNTSKEPGAP